VRRRGALGVALLTAEAARTAARFLMRARAEREQRRKAARLAEQIAFTADIHAEENLARVRQLQPDLGLVYGGPILKPELFTLPALGTLGIHHGKVPQYRGKKTTFWAMYNGEASVGVTIQLINAGVDAGMIVERGEVPTAGKWLPRVSRELEELGFQLYLQGVIALKRGTAAPVPQSGPKGKLYRDPSAADLLRFWLRQILRRLTSSA
jgi:methionyl-tRNA formyltransferase